MRTESQINADIKSNRSNWDSWCEEAKEINAKIARLKNALKHVKKAKGEAENARKAAKKLKVSDEWKGRLRDEFDDDVKNGIVDKADALADDIEEMKSEIKREIDELAGQVSLLDGLIAKVEDYLDDLADELQRSKNQSSCTCEVV